MTGSRDAAGDITHDAFLAVLADASRFDPRRASLSTYLYGIVRNLCRQRLRRASRLQPIDAATLERPADHAGASADPVADAELAVLVRRALADTAIALSRADPALRSARPVLRRRGPDRRRVGAGSAIAPPSRATAHEGVALGPDAIAGVPPQARTVRRMTIFPGTEPDPARRAWAAFARQDAPGRGPAGAGGARPPVRRPHGPRRSAPMPSAPAPVWRRWAAVAAALAAVLVSAVVLGRRPGPDAERLPGPITTAGESRLVLGGAAGAGHRVPAAGRERSARTSVAARPARTSRSPRRRPRWPNPSRCRSMRSPPAPCRSSACASTRPRSTPSGCRSPGRSRPVLWTWILVIGEDGWPRDVRRIRPVVAPGPPE